MNNTYNLAFSTNNQKKKKIPHHKILRKQNKETVAKTIIFLQSGDRFIGKRMCFIIILL